MPPEERSRRDESMNQQPAKMWSGRFREPLNKQFEEWQRSFPFDWRLLPHEVEASIAHARAIEAAGILTSEELLLMEQGLRAVAKLENIVSNQQAADIHHFVELELTNTIGGHAYAPLHGAEPVYIAHLLLAYVAMLERDYSRFVDARRRMNFCPLGSGAIAGATLALDRSIASDALGFPAPTDNSMDATSARDFMLDFAQAASTLGLHISRFAEEITLYATAEFNFVELPEAFSTGSSAMPQKKNPDLTELARGKSARLLGSATALSTLIKGLPLAYNKDLQEGQEQIFDVADTLSGVLRVLPGFTFSLKFRFDKMQTAAETGYLNAMAAATYLSNKGVPFRKAHEIIGNAVRLGLDKGLELNALPLSNL